MMATIVDRLNAWLGKLPSTNFKVVTTIGLYYLTFLLYAVATLASKTIDNVSFGMWLGFLAALGGFAYKTFDKQRTTDYGYLDRVKAAAPPAATPSPAPAAEATTS